MIKEILTYNINLSDINIEEFSKLYTTSRRDSTFAAAFETSENIYALRDHLGIVPLYYRKIDSELRFSMNYSDLVLPNDKINDLGLKMFIVFGTPRLISLIEEIKIVPPGAVIKFNKESLTSSEVYRYKIKPQKIAPLRSLGSIVNEADNLFDQAMKRLIKHDTVGLFFSGGMDSSLIAAYLKKNNIKINAYTSYPDNENAPEMLRAKESADYFQFNNHYFVSEKYGDLNTGLNGILKTYGSPHGTSVSLAVNSIWEKTPISNENQIFFGQNSDTLSCNVGIQVKTLLLNYIPFCFRKRLQVKYHHKEFSLPDKEVMKNYIYLKSEGIINHYLDLENLYNQSNLTRLQLITIAGICFGHTPTDSGVFTLPAINQKKILSNPFYDMDLIEYIIAIPLIFRIGFIFYLRKKIRFITFKPIITKRVIKRLAKKKLPHNLIFKKKGFSVNSIKLADNYITDEIQNQSELISNDYENKFNAVLFDYWWSRFKNGKV